ncbi:MAG: glycosyltransferase [Flavonifractor plautii]
MLKGLAAELGWSGRCASPDGSATPTASTTPSTSTPSPSPSETFPYSLTEGARAALPTIASRVGGVPYLIEHGVHGLLFEAGDADTLARHLITLAKDPTPPPTPGGAALSAGQGGFFPGEHPGAPAQHL